MLGRSKGILDSIVRYSHQKFSICCTKLIRRWPVFSSQDNLFVIIDPWTLYYPTLQRCIFPKHCIAVVFYECLLVHVKCGPFSLSMKFDAVSNPAEYSINFARSALLGKVTENVLLLINQRTINRHEKRFLHPQFVWKVAGTQLY